MPLDEKTLLNAGGGCGIVAAGKNNSTSHLTILTRDHRECGIQQVPWTREPPGRKDRLDERIPWTTGSPVGDNPTSAVAGIWAEGRSYISHFTHDGQLFSLPGNIFLTPTLTSLHIFQHRPQHIATSSPLLAPPAVAPLVLLQVAALGSYRRLLFRAPTRSVYTRTGCCCPYFLSINSSSVNCK